MLFPAPDTTVFAADSQSDFSETVRSYADDIDFGEFSDIYEEYKDYFNGETLLDAIKSRLDGSLPFGITDLISAVAGRIKDTFRQRLSQVLSVFFVAVFSAIVGAIRPNVSDGVGKLCDFIFSVVIIGVTFGIFTSFFNTVSDSIDRSAKIIEAAYPVLLTLMTSVGAGSSGAAFSPSVAFLSGFYIDIIKKILMPVVYVTFAFYTVGNLSDRIKLTKFGEFFKNAFKWIIGFITVLFCFILTVQSVTASTFDGFSYKALKYAFSNGVPFVSQMVQSGFDVVFASMVLIKNSVGTVAMVTVLLMLLSPIVELAVMGAVLRLVSALTEPIGSDFAKTSLSSCADVCGQLNALLICSGICFCLTLFLLITALTGSV